MTISTPKRPPPAYQEYASDMIARREYKELSFEARGFLWAMRMEWWVNGDFPADTNRLASYLGTTVEIVDKLLPQIKAFVENDGQSIGFADLWAYKLKLEIQREKMSAGGKKNAIYTNTENRVAK